MARIRSVKPEFWQDRKAARQLTRDQRMLYLALWNQADEWGRANADAVVIKGQAFPYDDDITPADIETMLAAIAGTGRVVLYEYEDDPYLYLPKLAKHQRLEPHKVPSRYPAPPQVEDQQLIPFADGTKPDSGPPEPYADTSTPIPDPSESRADTSAPDTDTSAPGTDTSALLYGTGSMEHGAGGRVPDRTRRATRIPEDFTPTASDRSKARELGFTDRDLDKITVEFIDYWRAIPGQRGLKLDWPATWRNRVRAVAERRQPQRHLATVSSSGASIKPWEL